MGDRSKDAPSANPRPITWPVPSFVTPTHTCQNGKIHNGKQTIGAVDCGINLHGTYKTRSLIRPPKLLIDKLLLERFPLAELPEKWVLCEPWPRTNAEISSRPPQMNVR